MSSQFFYVQLKFIPKMGIDRVPVITQHEAVVEVPKDLVQRKQSENTSANSREKVIVLELARRAALGTFPSIAHFLHEAKIASSVQCWVKIKQHD